jgi:hypothetical protein
LLKPGEGTARRWLVRKESELSEKKSRGNEITTAKKGEYN